MLKTCSGASIGDLSSGRFRKMLVVVQAAFSLVLLIFAMNERRGRFEVGAAVALRRS
jgi:hypothetical protein